MLYRWTRDLHLYLGLFISPFLLLFAVSVFVLNHAKVMPGQWTATETVQNVAVPANLESLRGRDAIGAGHEILRQVAMNGEIGSTRFVRQTGHFVFAVATPRLEASVDVDVKARNVTVSRRPASIWEAVAYLHKMPGPHNVAIRGNWAPIRAWSVFADVTIYLILFITISGIYIWWALRAERRIGLAVIAAGVLTFVGCLHALLH